MRFAILCAISSALCACATIERPNTYIWGVNAPKARLEGYNMRTDFDSNGRMKPEAKPVLVPLTSVKQLNVHWVVAPGNKPGDELKDEGAVGLKRYIGELRRYAKDNCK